MSDREVKQIRPLLKEIAPLSAWNVVAFGIFKVSLGLSLFFLADKITSFSKVGVLPVKIWALIFFFYGLIYFVNYLRNDWQHMKAGLLLGMFIMATWTLQLLSLSITIYRPLVITLLTTSSLVLWLQVGTYINFTPRMNDKR